MLPIITIVSILFYLKKPCLNFYASLYKFTQHLEKLKAIENINLKHKKLTTVEFFS